MEIKQLDCHLRSSVITCESVIRGLFVDFFFLEITLGLSSSSSAGVAGLSLTSGGDGCVSMVTVFCSLLANSFGLSLMTQNKKYF